MRFKYSKYDLDMDFLNNTLCQIIISKMNNDGTESILLKEYIDNFKNEEIKKETINNRTWIKDNDIRFIDKIYNLSEYFIRTYKIDPWNVTKKYPQFLNELDIALEVGI